MWEIFILLFFGFLLTVGLFWGLISKIGQTDLTNPTNLPVPRIVMSIPDEYEAPHRSWKYGDHLLYMGEIHNMPGHGVFVDRDGKTHWGYHPDEFREPTEEEL